MSNIKTQHNERRGLSAVGKRSMAYVVCFLIAALCIIKTENGLAAGVPDAPELHAFYPSNATFSEKVKNYIDEVDSLSFAWSRMDSEEPDVVNTTRDRNGNRSFFYPTNYLQPVEYAKSKGKSIQLNIYMDGGDCSELLPDENQRLRMVKAITAFIQREISEGKGIYFDGVVIDFEGLRDTSQDGSPLLYEGEPISAYFIRFLAELKKELKTLEKSLYVAVNPSVYYDGYDYASIINIADHVILMAHDYEPTERLTKKQVELYTGFDALEPINSMAPIQPIRQALNEIRDTIPNEKLFKKVLLQITFDSAQWQFDISDAEGWDELKDSVLSREGRLTPLYQSIKARVDNSDGKGKHLTYGYNNELQTPFLQYYNTADQSWNIILYEDSNSIKAKMNLARSYGLGGISIWSLANVPDYTDSTGKAYYLDGWSTILDQMNAFDKPHEGTKEYVSFSDPSIEQAIRIKLGKPSGKLTLADTKEIYRLKLPQGVKSLKDLKHLKNLEYLDAQQLGIKDISGLSSLTKLRVLYLQRNKISNIKPLKKLTKLEHLSLNGNQLVGIETLASLTKLQKLYLRENKITDITPLGKLKNLETLEIGKNNIRKIDALKSMKKISVLALDNNSITSVKALKGLTGLESLYLQRNAISDISAIGSLKKLQLVSLNGNKIKSITSINKLTRLELLYLKDNKITDISSLKGMTRLRELYLNGNPIKDYGPLEYLLQKTDFKGDFQ